ncbi:hypothetical protein [Anaerosalibacter sp. Marseille-P3206]|uniref:hypothetical protein n=1 Tax=Anaerosalibacter sp. Marseille-P3206 TaxID=1871005 RepID=UPI000987A2FB|nr:hypothetical protein [Anaerosalibacter sp. Marseille-P3206]
MDEQGNYQNHIESSDKYEIMSVKDWVITLLLLVIPIVNIILLFVWAFSGDTNENKKNYCKAQLIMLAIILGINIIIAIISGISMLSLMRYY